MPALPYPTASYPNDPLEIPIDTLLSIDMEIYHPGLIHHEATSGAQFFLRRGLPRWRGTASWAAVYTNSHRAGAMEGYLTSMSEGIYTSTLKHGREVLDVDTLWKRGDGIGKASLSDSSMDPPPVVEDTPTHKPGQVFKVAGTSSPRIYMVTSIDEDDITFTPEIDIFGTASSVSLDETEANGFITVRATPGSTINLPRTRTLSGPWNMSWIEGVQ